MSLGYYFEGCPYCKSVEACSAARGEKSSYVAEPCSVIAAQRPVLVEAVV